MEMVEFYIYPSSNWDLKNSNVPCTSSPLPGWRGPRRSESSSGTMKPLPSCAVSLQRVSNRGLSSKQRETKKPLGLDSGENRPESWSSSRLPTSLV